MPLKIKGEDILKKREELGLTQRELAEILGFTDRTLRTYETTGKIPSYMVPLMQNFVEGKIIGNNINTNNNLGTIAGNNVVQISLPEAGTQKIIRPDGTIEIEHLASVKEASQSQEMSNINDLLDKIEIQKKTIKSLEGTIKAQQHIINLLTKNKG